MRGPVRAQVAASGALDARGAAADGAARAAHIRPAPGRDVHDNEQLVQVRAAPRARVPAAAKADTYECIFVALPICTS